MAARTSPPRLHTIAQAAELLGVSENHVYRLIASGELSAVDVSQRGAKRSKSRIRDDELARLIDARTSNAKRLKAAG